LFAILLGWPWIERAFTHDDASHQLLDHPREMPLRTAFGVVLALFALGLTLAGSGDVQARYAHVPITTLTAFYRWFCIVAPVLGGIVTYYVAQDLCRRGGVQRAPRLRLRRNASGGFDEENLP
jgi:ubiquinol-cytochrome c reductase cytochrome b subunit